MSFLDRFRKKRELVPPAEYKSAPVSAPKKEVAADAAVAIHRAESTVAKVYVNNVIRHSVVSEKAAHSESRGAYTFMVADGVNKLDIKRAVKELYGVIPTSVRIINREGKRIRFGRSLGKRQDSRKAIVTLPKGKTISVHEGV